MINGVSSASLYTVAISYIENLFSQEQVHIRQGVYYVTGAIGVGFGAIVAGNFLKIKDTESPNDPLLQQYNNLKNFNMIGVILKSFV